MSVISVRSKYEANLLSIQGVTGVSNSTDRIIVYVAGEDVISRVPNNLDGIPVQCVVSGPIGALSW